MCRRPMSDRLRDERNNRRERDRNDRFNDHDSRYDRPEGSHHAVQMVGPMGAMLMTLCDFNAIDEAEDKLGDKLQGKLSYKESRQFSSSSTRSGDIPPPPPVLMPMHGAGPLGPFVPAPLDVAIRMLREQGGPIPFEANGGPRGRKGRSRPPMAGPALILSVPPMRHDPCRIRSYQDLNTPDDEHSILLLSD